MSNVEFAVLHNTNDVLGTHDMMIICHGGIKEEDFERSATHSRRSDELLSGFINESGHFVVHKSFEGEALIADTQD